MKRILLCLICIFSLLGSKAQSYNELVEKAMDYTFKDSLQQAEELFREALRLTSYSMFSTITMPGMRCFFLTWEPC